MEHDITIYLAKAAESLLTAESEFANGRYNSCANRCYSPMVLVSYKPLKKHRSIKTIVCVFELAVVRRLRHAGLGDILPLRGELHDHGGVYHGIVLRGR